MEEKMREFGFDPDRFQNNCFRPRPEMKKLINCSSCGGVGWIEFEKENGEMERERCDICKGKGFRY